MNKRHGIFVVCMLFLVLAGCKSITATYLSEQKFPPREADYPVQLIQRGVSVDKEYILLAQLNAHYLPPTRFSAIPDSLMVQIRAKVRSIGGDAVINLDIYQAPAGSVGLDSYTIQGQIVRWQ